jgi:hypothetical protein
MAGGGQVVIVASALLDMLNLVSAPLDQAILSVASSSRLVVACLVLAISEQEADRVSIYGARGSGASLINGKA